MPTYNSSLHDFRSHATDEQIQPTESDDHDVTGPAGDDCECPPSTVRQYEYTARVHTRQSARRAVLQLQFRGDEPLVCWPCYHAVRRAWGEDR